MVNKTLYEEYKAEQKQTSLWDGIFSKKQGKPLGEMSNYKYTKDIITSFSPTSMINDFNLKDLLVYLEKNGYIFSVDYRSEFFRGKLNQVTVVINNISYGIEIQNSGLTSIDNHIAFSYKFPPVHKFKLLRYIAKHSIESELEQESVYMSEKKSRVGRAILSVIVHEVRKIEQLKHLSGLYRNIIGLQMYGTNAQESTYRKIQQEIKDNKMHKLYKKHYRKVMIDDQRKVEEAI